MSGFVEKVKDKVEQVLHKDKTHDDTTGPHSSHSANKADPRVDSDHAGTYGNTGGANTTHSHGTTGSGLTGSNTHGTTHGTTGSGLTGSNNNYGSDPTGPHDSHLGNKADPRVDSDRYGAAGNHSSTTHGTTGHSSGLAGNTYGSDPTGPHDSHLANKADPRIDSDRYGAAGNTGGQGYNHSGLTGTGHSSGLTGGNTYGSDPTGPHNSHLANQADPRVDSDRYGAAGNTGGFSGSTGGHSAGGLAGHSTGHNTSGNYGSDPSGPHNSNFANKIDPRVDSSTAGPHGNTAGARGGAYGSDPTGPHDSHLGNRADPRVDSSTTGGYGNTHSTGGYGSNTGAGVGSGAGGFSSGPGPAENTAGPYKSDMMNKLDPRVDSDLDGSKTYGGNKTSGY